MEDAVRETDIVILPEMFSTGFTMASVEMAETMSGPTVAWMKDTAERMNIALCGSVIIEEDGHYYNRLIWASPGEDIAYYDKRHLFRMANEHEFYSAGNESLIVEHKGWKIKPLVCYDLRFPVWTRNTGNSDGLCYDILIYVANWPESRIGAWDSLLRARAVENLCYTVGVNRYGKDGKDVYYNGHSAVYDFKGREQVMMTAENEVRSIQLSYDQLMKFREDFPAQLDADIFSIV